MEDITKHSEDGVKEINTATQEFYEEIEDLEDTLVVDEEKTKKTIYDHIRIGLIIASYIIFFFVDFNKHGFPLMAFAIILFTIATFFMGAIKKFITEGDDSSLLFRFTFFLRIGLLFLFFISLMMIFFTINDELNYSYWIALISFLMVATLDILENAIEDLRSRKNHSLLSRIFRIILNLFLLMTWINMIGLTFHISLPVEGSRLVVNQLETPDELTILRYNNKSSHDYMELLDSMITITDRAFLEKLTADLENRSYIPMDMISVLNFSKQEYTADEYYQLSLFYKDSNHSNNIFAFPLSTMKFINETLVFQDYRDQSDRWLFKNKISDYYYIKLSKDTKDQLDSYIATFKE
ncbi:MAG: hypothetical protein K0R34_1993 [Herbinix sp.]|jgi:hypothetical protein|nr:hypothetical protein [Herbinix sp.]